MNYITATPPTSENIFFDLTFDADFWDQPPQIDILVDGDLVEQHTVDCANYSVRFRRVMKFGYPHVLEIHRHGKTNDQTKISLDGQIQTQTLHIKTVKLDNIDLRNIVWHTSEFYPEYPEPWATEQRDQGNILEYPVPGEMYLGHNGTWRFEFTSPIYEFLVDWARSNR